MMALPKRPPQVVVGAALLLGGGGVLAFAWALGLDAVESNGARVFFVVLWSYLAWTTYGGGGWARWAIVAIFAVTVWGGVNAPSLRAVLADLTVGEAAAKALALVALGFLLHPAARTWFAAVRKVLAGVDEAQKAS